MSDLKRDIAFIVTGMLIFAAGLYIGFRLGDFIREPQVVYRFVSVPRYSRLNGKRVEGQGEIKISRYDSLQCLIIHQEEELRKFLNQR